MNFFAREWDFVVVGAGSAGATVAARLSENADRYVLLIEAGGSPSPLSLIPALVEQGLTSRTTNWQFQGEPDPTLNHRHLVWAAGRALGGSSSINGMVFGRGLPAGYDSWQTQGNAGWSWKDMLPAFIKLETWTGAPHETRGTSGPIHVRPFTETELSCESAMHALIEAGTPLVEDYCTGISHGVGLTQASQKNGLRHGTARAYLRPAGHRPNLRIQRHCRADRLIITSGRCTGVEVFHHGARQTIRARREIILAAGAIGTPKLLLLSGIGAPEAVRPHGIAVTHVLAGVGQNLTDHVNIKISAFVNTPTYNTARRGPAALRHAARLAVTGTGPASSPANHVQAFVRTSSDLPTADIQIQLMPFGFGTDAEMKQNGITAVVSPTTPHARGKITLRDANPGAAPVITMPMLGHPPDIANLTRGCEHARAALAAGPGKSFGARLYAPSTPPASPADWLAFFRQTAALNWHPTSTCRMGPSPDDGAVVDARLAVHGITGLCIADASIMPTIPAGNTNAPTIAIAERAASFIAARAA